MAEAYPTLQESPWTTKTKLKNHQYSKRITSQAFQNQKNKATTHLQTDTLGPEARRWNPSRPLGAGPDRCRPADSGPGRREYKAELRRPYRRPFLNGQRKDQQTYLMCLCWCCCCCCRCRIWGMGLVVGRFLGMASSRFCGALSLDKVKHIHHLYCQSDPSSFINSSSLQWSATLLTNIISFLEHNPWPLTPPSWRRNVSECSIVSVSKFVLWNAVTSEWHRNLGFKQKPEKNCVAPPSPRSPHSKTKALDQSNKLASSTQKKRLFRRSKQKKRNFKLVKVHSKNIIIIIIIIISIIQQNWSVPKGFQATWKKREKRFESIAKTFKTVENQPKLCRLSRKGKAAKRKERV